MHRDITLTNRASIDRWITALLAQLESFQEYVRNTDDASAEQIERFFSDALDRRAEWAVQTSREAELLGTGATDASKDGLGDQMSRMFLGGFMRKKRLPAGSESSKNGTTTTKR
jgi:hypothetical protein